MLLLAQLLVIVKSHPQPKCQQPTALCKLRNYWNAGGMPPFCSETLHAPAATSVRTSRSNVMSPEPLGTCGTRGAAESWMSSSRGAFSAMLCYVFLNMFSLSTMTCRRRLSGCSSEYA
jgi:hypothetical protein